MQFCKHCGSPFEGQFCGKCGTPAGQAQAYTAAPPPPPQAPPGYAPAPPPPSYQAPPPPYQAPPPAYAAPAPAPGYAPPSPPSKGFFGSLFDFSFTSFVAPKIIKFLFVLLIIGVILAALYVVYLGVQLMRAPGGESMGLLFLIGAPIGAFLYLLLGRIWLEVMMVLFRIVEHTAEIARNTRR